MRILLFALLTGLVIAGITAIVMIMLGKAKLR
jgi:ABC-type nickel/cobalt efflux system permease component RcnA